MVDVSFSGEGVGAWVLRPEERFIVGFCCGLVAGSRRAVNCVYSIYGFGRVKTTCL